MKKLVLILALILTSTAFKCGGGSKPRPAPPQPVPTPLQPQPTPPVEATPTPTPLPADLPTPEPSPSPTSTPTPSPTPSPEKIVNVTEPIVIEGEFTPEIATYRSTAKGATFLLKNGAQLRCKAGTVLEETTAEGQADGSGTSPITGLSVFTIVKDYNGSKDNGAKSENIRVEGCTFRGVRKDFNSAHQTVSLGNCHNCQITGNTFIGVRTIAAQFGGASYLDHYAKDSEISDNTFIGCTSQNAAVTNGQNIQVVRNKFINPGIFRGPGTSVIDVEPNTDDLIDNVLIADNLIDARESPIDHERRSMAVTNGIVIQAGNPTRAFKGVVVRNNTILGANASQVGFNNIAYAGILLRADQGTLVEGNSITRVAYGIKVDTESVGAEVINNTLKDCGSGSTAPLDISTDSKPKQIGPNKIEDSRLRIQK